MSLVVSGKQRKTAEFSSSRCRSFYFHFLCQPLKLLVDINKNTDVIRKTVKLPDIGTMGASNLQGLF